MKITKTTVAPRYKRRDNRQAINYTEANQSVGPLLCLCLCPGAVLLAYRVTQKGEGEIIKTTAEPECVVVTNNNNVTY